VTIGPGNGKVPNTFRVTVPGNGLNIHNAGGVR